MICAYFRRKLPLYMSSDLAVRTTARVQKHLAHCRSCRLELKQLQAFQSRLEQCIGTPPAEAVDGFAEGVMQRILRPSYRPDIPVRKMSLMRRASFRHQLIFAGMFMALSCFALVRQALMDKLIQPREMTPSIVTRDGAIVSQAQHRGQNAAINVVKDREDMVIIWLNTPPRKTDQARRG